MKKRNKQNKFFNLARGLIIAYSIFIGIFALDTKFYLGFFIHLIPTFIFLGTLILTWKKPKLAGILFILEGLGTVIVFNTYRDLFVLLIISLIPILIGTLFLLSKNPKH
jgi:hypothetical protein